MEYSAEEGRYDLRISNATYDRDNGQYECRMKRRKSGETLHSKSLALTVLLRPSPPVVRPAQLPVAATEGRPVNLTCSSVGGSPAPQVKWFREGADQELDARVERGANRDVPTTSTLTVRPTKENDGAVYRSDFKLLLSGSQTLKKKFVFVI